MQIISGQDLAKEIKIQLKEKVLQFNKKPCLAVILVGENPASKVYIKNKEKACKECGFESLVYGLYEDTPEEELLELIDTLNKNDEVDGVLVQLPLPKHINEENVLKAIDPRKDVDCFNPLNIGKFFSSKHYFTVPCTASGCIKLIKTVTADLVGKNAVVIGRSNIVGKPVAKMLLDEDCSVTMLHSKSKNINTFLATADIIVVAVGRPKLLKADVIKDGAIIIDVGINRLDDGSLCGDVDFEEFLNKDCFITPVPRGVGPMTIACLLENTFKCFENRRLNYD